MFCFMHTARTLEFSAACRSEAEVSSDTSEYGTPAGTFCGGGCQGVVFCRAARSANTSASARVLYGTTRLDLQLHAPGPASVWL